MARRKNVKRIDPRYFLHETVNRCDDGSALEEGSATATVHDPDVHRPEGEEIEEGIFDAVGDMVSRTGLAGAKAKKNVFWRKKGKSRYESKIDDTSHATNWDFREFFEDGDEYDASYRGIGRAWDDYLATVVKPKQRAGKKANDAYERKKQRESDAAERAKQQAREDREEAEREAYRNSPEGRRKAARDAEIQADRDKKARVRAAHRARKEREGKSGGSGSWTDVFDFSHQLEEQMDTTATFPAVGVSEAPPEGRLDKLINWMGDVLSRVATGLTDEELAALSDLEVRDLLRGIGGDPTGGFTGGPESMLEEKE